MAPVVDPRGRPLRSVLYIPGSKERALEKARDLAADAIIFDLEDAVAAEEKENARAMLAQALAAGGYGSRLKIVRINGFDTRWGRDDAAAFARAAADAILVPKVDAGRSGCGRSIGARPAALGDDGNARRHSERRCHRHPRLRQGMVMGTQRPRQGSGPRPARARGTGSPACSFVLLAARSRGLAIVDGVFNAFKDEVGRWNVNRGATWALTARP